MKKNILLVTISFFVAHLSLAQTFVFTGEYNGRYYQRLDSRSVTANASIEIMTVIKRIALISRRILRLRSGLCGLFCFDPMLPPTDFLMIQYIIFPLRLQARIDSAARPML